MPAPVRKSRPRRMGAAAGMGMFPHTVTVYTVSVETDPATLEDRRTNHITVLRGVFLDESKAVNVRESGLAGADAVNLYIPYGVSASDGVTGEEKTYIGPVEFWRLEDKGKYWTLSTGGDTFFVKGAVVEPNASVDLIEMKYDGVYTMTKVDNKDYGGLKHWEVGGA